MCHRGLRCKHNCNAHDASMAQVFKSFDAGSKLAMPMIRDLTTFSYFGSIFRRWCQKKNKKMFNFNRNFTNVVKNSRFLL